ERGRAGGGEEIFASRESRTRVSYSRQSRRKDGRRKGGRVMATQTRTQSAGTTVPALGTERAVTWPKRTRVRLANGLEVLLAESHSIPKFHGQLSFRSGNAAAIERGPGLAEMTATVVRTGTKLRVSRRIEEDLRSLGADLSSSAGADTSAIAFAGLTELAEPLLGLVN